MVHVFSVSGSDFLFSERCSQERDALILQAGECVTRSILCTAPLEDHNRVVYRKPDFMIGDATLDTNQQLLAGEGQWLFNMEGKKHYLPLSKRHFSISYFQSITVPRKMKWAVTQSTDSVHIGVLTLSSYNSCRSPKVVLGMHPGR